MLNLAAATAFTSKELATAIMRDPIAVSPAVTVREVIALMSGARSHCEADSTAQAESNHLHFEARSSCVVVVESQKVVGILTERDVVRLCANQQLVDEIPVRQVMTASVLTLREAALTDLFSAISVLQQNHIRHLPIINEQDCLVGLVTHETLRQVLQPSDLLRLRLVREVMTQTVITADPTDSLLAVAQRMANDRISSVVVVERHLPEDVTLPLGIVTERDLVQFQALGLDFERYHAAQVMSAPVVSVAQNETLVMVQQLLERYLIRRVVVTGEAGELLGIVTQTDVLKALSPLELYKLTEVLEARVKQLETEKVNLLESRNLELETQIASRTQTLQKQLQREKIVAHLSTQIRSSLSLQSILETTAEHIHQMLGCDRVNIWKFEPDRSTVVVAESTHSSRSLMGKRVRDECYQQRITEVYREGHVRVVPDIYTTEMSDCHRELLISLQTRAKVLLPLFCGEQLWGLLNVSESQTARAWQADEVELLRNLANQLTIAIQQASTHAQLQVELQERQQAQILLQVKNDLLARVAVQEPLTDILNHACTAIEGIQDGAMCSILLLDDNDRLRDGAAPSLPDHYRRYVDGVQVGEGVGSCGTAVHRRKRVIVADIASDPLWQDVKDPALASNLRACWSTPIVAGGGVVLGTFAIYYGEVRSPRADEMTLVDSLVHIVMLAIQRHQSEITLKQANLRLQEAQRIAHIGNWEQDHQRNTFYWSEEVFHILEIDPQQLGASYETFLGLVHPDDRTLVDEAYVNHLQSCHPTSLVHRLQMSDGRIKYVQEQWETTYSVDGTPLISRRTMQDMTQQKEAEIRRDRAEAALRQVVEGTAAVTDEAFFPALVRHISEALGVRYASIDQAMPDGFQVLAFFADGELSPPLFLPYDELPCCFKSLQTGRCCHPTGVQALYPDNALFTDLQVDSYVGVRLQNAAGDPIGNLCILHDAPLADPDWAQTLLTIFAARAGAELERLMTAQALEQLNAELETRIAERTAELAEREALLQDFLDNANDLIQMVNIDTGRFEFVNRAWQNVLGYSTTEVAQLNCFEVLAPDCHAHCQAMLAKMRSGGVTHLDQMELTFVGKSGQRVVVEGNINCRFVTEADGSQRPVSTRAIFRDITAKRAAEQELQRREARYRALMEGASDAILLANTEGYLVEVNPQAVDLMGYEHHELVGMHITQIHPPEALPAATEAFETLAQEGRIEALNLEILRRDGQRVPVDITGAVIEVGGETILQGIFHDIRERLQAEQALRQSEIRFRSVFESNVVGMMFTDFSGRICDANDRFLAMLGYTRQDLNSGCCLNWADLTPLEYQAKDQAAIAHLQHHDAIDPWEKAYRHKDGHLVQVLIGVGILSREEMSCVGVVVDISDRKRYETALQESQQFLQTVLDTVPLAVFWKDRVSHYLGANRRFLRDAALSSASELVGKTDFDMPWGATEAEAYQANDRSVMASGVAKLGIIETLHQQDGTKTWLETNKLPLHNLAGEVVGVLGTYEDITARRDAEIAMRRQLAAIEAAIDGIGILQDERYIYLNSSHVELLGYQSTQELLGQSWRILYSPEALERFDQEVFPALYEQMFWQGEVIATRKNGTTFPQQLSLTLTADNLLICVCQDISDRKAAEAALRRTNAELERATRLKDEFLANMSHELRTPLNAILGMAEGLQEEVFGPITERQQYSLHTIERSGTHLLSLITDILDLSKIEANQLELEFVAVDVEMLCNSSLTFVKQQAYNKRLQIETQISSHLPKLYGDERRLCQVLINLLTNAVKFTAEGGRITLSTTYTSLPPEVGANHRAFVHPQGEWSATAGILSLAVADTGIGISPENAKKLFQPFVQIDSALNRQHQGTGLGLALVKRITELHGGTVELISEVGVGSCFTLQLPVMAIPSESFCAVDLTASVEALMTLESTTAPLVLLAEDNEANINTTTAYLTAKGYCLIVARNGIEAVNQARTSSPDLILMDIQMPHLDGLEAIRQIRQMPGLANVPIVALTALAMPDDRERCLAAGADEYISKPIRLKQLAQVMQTLLAKPSTA